MKKLLQLAAMIFLTGCATTPWKETTAELDMNLSSTVTQELRKHVVSAPKTPLQSIKRSQAISFTSDVAKLVTTLDYSLEYSSNADGTLAERMSATFTKPRSPYNGSFLGTGTNICALLNVVNESLMTSTQQAVGSIPTGGFVTFGMGTNVEMHIRLDNLTTSAANICLPVLGSSFTYQASTTHSRRIRNTSAGINVGGSLAEMIDRTTFSCVVDAVAHPAQEITAGLRGDYVKVSCDGIFGEDNRKMQSTYAYLIDSQIYLKLAETKNDTLQLISYTDPVYVGR